MRFRSGLSPGIVYSSLVPLRELVVYRRSRSSGDKLWAYRATYIYESN